MCQWAVIEFLGANPRQWFCAAAIAEATGLSRTAVDTSLLRLRRSRTVSFRRVASPHPSGCRVIHEYKYRGVR